MSALLERPPPGLHCPLLTSSNLKNASPWSTRFPISTLHRHNPTSHSRFTPRAARSKPNSSKKPAGSKQGPPVLVQGPKLVSAPSLTSENPTPPATEPVRNPTPPSQPPLATPVRPPESNLVKILWKQTIRRLANLKLAIAELVVIAGLSALGTLIEQGQKVAYYAERYPESPALYGFFTWKWIVNLQLDHIYSSGYFLGLLVLLGASLAACTSTTQWPMVKVARRWSFKKSAAQYKALEMNEVLERARITDLAALMSAKGYEVFVRGHLLYGFKGLIGKLGPIGVHASLLLIMGGAAYSALGGFVGSTMTPQGQEFYVGDALVPVGPFSVVPSSAQELRLHVNQFTIAYRESGEVEQFYSDLSLLDLNDREVLHKVISVNTPLRYGGVTMYQTDWAISAMQLRVDGSSIRLPMASLTDEEKSGKLFGTFLRTGDGSTARGVSLITKDFQSVVLYGPDGQFVGVRRPGSNRPITIDGKEIVVEDLIGATGMELKVDPGVPYVYAGFAGLLVTVFVSFVSHSQVWAMQEGQVLFVGGKTSKNRLAFDIEMNELLNSLPEYVSKDGDGESGRSGEVEAQGAPLERQPSAA